MPTPHQSASPRGEAIRAVWEAPLRILWDKPYDVVRRAGEDRAELLKRQQRDVAILLEGVERMVVDAAL